MKNEIIGAKVIKKPEDLMPVLKEGIDAIPTHKKTNKKIIEEVLKEYFTKEGMEHLMKGGCLMCYKEIFEKVISFKDKEFQKKIDELEKDLDAISEGKGAFIKIIKENAKREAQKKFQEKIDRFGGWLILNYERKTKEGILDKLGELKNEKM